MTIMVARKASTSSATTVVIQNAGPWPLSLRNTTLSIHRDVAVDEITPKQWTADTSTQAFKDRYALAKGRAVDWLKGQIKREELTDKLKVLDEDATQGLVDQVAGGKTP